MPARKHFFRKIKIDKYIPLPKPNAINAPITTKLKNMKVGHSVFVKTREEAVSIRVILGRLGFKSTRRKVSSGFRIWRVKNG